MRVLVTGSNGFIGRRLVEFLKKEQCEVIQYDIDGGYDITDWEKLRSIKNIDVIVHLASKLFVPDSYKDPHTFFRVNIEGTLNCLEYCRQNNSKLVYVSSYLYGNTKGQPVREDHVLEAFNPYAASKIECERLCKYYFDFFGTKSIILRPFNVFGKGQNVEFLVPKIIDQAQNGRIRLKLSTPRRDFVYVDDVVDGIVRSIFNKEILHDTINLASGINYSVLEVVEIIKSNFVKDIKVSFENELRQNEVDETLGDITKAEKLLDWKPKFSFEEGIRLILST